MARVLDQLQLHLAPERVRVRTAELDPQVRVAGGPQDQGGAPQLSEPSAGTGEDLRRRRPVQPQNRVARAAVEVPPDAVDEPCGQRARCRVRLTRDLLEAPLRRGRHEELAHHRSAPDARDPMPAVPGEKRHGRVDDQALDPLRKALRESQADHAPVVDDEREALHPHRVDERLEPPVVARDRVVEAGRLLRRAESRQVRGDAAGSLEVSHPVPGGGRDAVDVEDVRATVVTGLPIVGPQPRDLQLALNDLRHPPRFYHRVSRRRGTCGSIPRASPDGRP